ncbi:hypothetical protein GCM10010517_66510 [Streptosporangium fragile]|uniref:Uncharacterized protein n=1 Tax=Streptosporangium fragile TaxID=46186 RepID=A0ABP6IPR3_9ACTN
MAAGEVEEVPVVWCTGRVSQECAGRGGRGVAVSAPPPLRSRVSASASVSVCVPGFVLLPPCSRLCVFGFSGGSGEPAPEPWMPPILRMSLLVILVLTDLPESSSWDDGSV